MDLKPLSSALTAIVLTAAHAQAATPFPGGEPITLNDLTATPPALPAAPPEYVSATDTPNHEAFARFAWREFIYLNSPAAPLPPSSGPHTTVQRGVVSPQGNFVLSGDPRFYWTGRSSGQPLSRNILVWQSLAHRSELFPKDGTPSGDFQNLAPRYLFENVSVEYDQARFNNLDENSQIGQNKIFFPKNGQTPATNPYDDDEVLFEAKVNQVEYDYIKSLGGRAPDSFNLPNESLEIKAAWRMLDQDLIDSGRYHTAEAVYYEESGGTLQPRVGTFGLVGLHIIRRMENYEAFVYATFQHVDNLKSGIYFVTTYNNLDYAGTAGDDPHAIVNSGPNRTLVPLPKQGAVNAANGYAIIPGHYQLPTGAAGPVRVVQPPTITEAVYNVNREVKQVMASSPQFSDSVWQYYELKGVQPLPTDEDASVTSPVNPLTQDFFLANDVIESSQPGVQLFKGGAPPIPSGSFTLTNPRSGANAVNIQNVPGLGAAYNNVVMGGCMGCHGRSLYDNADGTQTSIFNFLVSKRNLNGEGGFEADAINESDAMMMMKSNRYMTR